MSDDSSLPIHKRNAEARKRALIDDEDRLIYFSNLFSDYLQSSIDDYISPSETMRDQWYLSVGLSGIRAVYGACVTSWVGKISNVLDLPCGHGRILRHLVKFFPQASFDAADLDREGVNFCADRFGAHPVYSQEDLTKVNFGKKYDLIWVGSLFTHVARERTQAWLNHLAKFLDVRGIIVATFHGRYSALMGAEFGYTTPECWESILAGYEKTGYGYADYPSSMGCVTLNGGYGVSLSKPTAVLEDVSRIPGVRVFNYIERGWAGHQDVLVLGRPEISVV
jgi:SAM-dependent methyltransferase